MEAKVLESATAPVAPAVPAHSRRELWLLVLGLTALYVLMVAIDCRRFIWYDELFTFDIAKARTVGDVIRLDQRWDFNPPTAYLLSRWSMELFGQNAFGLRLPSMLAFYAASMLLFLAVRRRAATVYAALGLLVLWWSDSFRYATEARPYALVALFFASLLLCWDRVRHGQRSLLWGVAASSLGLVLSHFFAPLALLPFLAAEAFASMRRRSIDLPLVAALLLPILAMLSYLPFMATYQQSLFAPEIRASLRRLGRFWYDTLEPVALPLLLAGLAACVVADVAVRRAKRVAAQQRTSGDLVVLCGLLLNPLLLTGVLMLRHGAFWDRYCITTQIAVYMGLAILLGRLLRGDRRAGYVAALVLLCVIIPHRVQRTWFPSGSTHVLDLSKVPATLPIVIDNGVTFFEMNHYERPEVLSRLFFLMDRQTAIQYAHSTGFEYFDPPERVKADFPLPAHLEHYDAFVAAHTSFAVFSTHDNHDGWLLQRLRADHAHIEPVGEYAAPDSFRDSTLYSVTMPRN